jgi:hypothetical protein
MEEEREAPLDELSDAYVADESLDDGPLSAVAASGSSASMHS